MINRSMIQAAVTMGQLQSKLDLIGHNLSNSSTTGYKSRSADFSSLLFQQIDNLSHDQAKKGRMTPDGIRVGTGARLGHTNLNLNQGSIQQTGRALDVAIMNENQLFSIRVPGNDGDDIHYTRAGNFYMNPNGEGQVMLTDSEGLPVLDEDGENILINEGFSDIHIQQDGAIVVTRGGDRSVEGQLGVLSAVRPRMLEAVGDNRFKIPDGIEQEGIIEGVPQADIQLQSKALESSNVDLSQQMTEMMMAQRAYQFNAKSISTGDQMMGLVNQLRS
ncbi:flagellar hook-basal body protein [Halobacillus yeomjeoni]|uniref:flagellar hook-basal body protein n=1 Tax=Halobacillus yeomjeoni TaxID=311194 RepID=UPI001F555E1E|nr:flagellar hook-basal body protein [Halobacillus yeomjeoni]